MSIGDCFIPTSPVTLSPQVASDGATAVPAQYRGPMG